MASTFKATHVITLKSGEEIPVEMYESILYTRAEWEADARADWEYALGGVLTFRGSTSHPFCDGVSVRRVSR